MSHNKPECKKRTIQDFFGVPPKKKACHLEMASGSQCNNVCPLPLPLTLPTPQAEETATLATTSHMDISHFNRRILSAEEKLEVLTNIWVPDENYKFPVVQIGKQNRKFIYTWLKRYKWLVYSKKEDGAYCKHCFLFASKEVGMSASQTTGQLVSTSFKQWKKATERFDNHEALEYHKASLLRSNNFLESMSGKSVRIDKMIDSVKNVQAAENRTKIMSIIKTVIFCGRQGLALRGHRDSGPFELNEEPPENEGNFRALLRFRIDAGDQNLRNHLTGSSRNAVYTSWKIQNEIIDSCATIIKRKIASEVNAAKCFSVLADETPDISNIEQVTLCVRYLKEDTNLKEYKICENFLQFTPVENTTGVNLAETIIRSLQDCNIEVDYLRGQGYDGASSMSGKFNGTQAKILEKYPTAIYVHCVSHCLNLAISNSVEVPAIRNSFGIVTKIYNFFNYPKRQIVLQKHISQSKNVTKTRAQKLKQLCPTRWVDRHDSILIMVDLLVVVVDALEEIQTTWEDKETTSDVFILISAIKQSQFLVALLSAEKLLSHTVNLSKSLQLSDVELHLAINEAQIVIDAIKKIRDNGEEAFKQLFQKALQISERLGFSITVPRTTSRQTKRCNIPFVTEEEYYRRAIFLPWIDSFLSNLSARFEKHKSILANFDALLPNTENQLLKKGDFINLSTFYANDLEERNEAALEAEYDMWHQALKKIGNPPKNAIDCLNVCNKNYYPNIHKLLKIFCTLPVSTSTAERSFSTLKRTKTYLRNTMKENRLNGLAHLNIHREILVTIDEVIQELQLRGPRRLEFNL